MKLYMAVTADVYELPLCVEDTATELAQRLGIAMQTVCSACTPLRREWSGKQRGYRIIRVETDEKGPARQRKPQSEPQPSRKSSSDYTTVSVNRTVREALHGR